MSALFAIAYVVAIFSIFVALVVWMFRNQVQTQHILIHTWESLHRTWMMLRDADRIAEAEGQLRKLHRWMPVYNVLALDWIRKVPIEEKR